MCRFRKVFGYSDNELDQLLDQISEIKVHKDFLQASSEYSNDTDITEFWLNCKKLTVGSSTPFIPLCNLALCISIIPHSNASAERMFSMINKNIGGARSMLRKDTTVNDLMIVKSFNLPIDFQPSPQLIKKAKAATRLSLVSP